MIDPLWAEWLNILGRWIHVIAGIMWVGNSMLFNWLDPSAKPGYFTVAVFMPWKNTPPIRYLQSCIGSNGNPTPPG